MPTATARLGRNSSQPTTTGSSGSLSPLPGNQASNSGAATPTNAAVNGCSCSCQCPLGVFSLSGSSQTPTIPLSALPSVSALPPQSTPSKTTFQTIVSNATGAAPAASVPSPASASTSSDLVATTSLAAAQSQVASTTPATTSSGSGLNLQTFTLKTAITVPLDLGASSVGVVG